LNYFLFRAFPKGRLAIFYQINFLLLVVSFLGFGYIWGDQLIWPFFLFYGFFLRNLFVILFLSRGKEGNFGLVHFPLSFGILGGVGPFFSLLFYANYSSSYGGGGELTLLFLPSLPQEPFYSLVEPYIPFGWAPIRDKVFFLLGG